MSCGIYLITQISTGRKYVGQSIDIPKRWYMHARGNKRTWLGKAVLKHGWHDFKTEILELCDRGELNDAEAKWIAYYDCFAPNGFNLTTGGGQAEFSEETMQKLRYAQRNRSSEHTARKNAAASDPDVRAKISASLKGRTFSAESKLKLSLALKGRTFSEETISAMRVAAKERAKSPEFLERTKAIHNGKPLSEEHRVKLSAAHKKRYQDDPTARQRCVENWLGREHSPETLEKMRADRKSDEWRQMCASAAKGKKQSPEQIAKRVAATLATKKLKAAAAASAAIASTSGDVLP